MTRIAFDVGTGWGSHRLRGRGPADPAGRRARRADTFQNARLWDYRPLQDTLDQLQTVRQYYDFTDVDTDRYTIQGTLRQVMLSARELAPGAQPAAAARGSTSGSRSPTASAWRWCRSTRRPRAASPQLIVRDLPPVSTAGAPQIRQPRIYFGERPSDWIITGARQDEFDYPVGSSDTDGAHRVRPDDPLDRHDRDQARHDPVAAAVRPPVPGPEPADQRPGHRRQPAPVPSLARRSAAVSSRRSCASTRIPTWSSPPTAGSSTSRTPTRRATGSRTPSRSTRRPCRARRAWPAPRSTTSATA